MATFMAGTLEALFKLQDQVTPTLLQIQKTAKTVSKSLDQDLGVSTVKKLGEALTDNVGGKVAAVAVAGAAAIAGALALATKSMLDMADQTSNLSASTGIGVESLQKLGFVGAAVGVSMEQIAGGMQKFQRNLVEGSTGTIDALNKLGLSRESLANMLPEEQLTTVLTALNDKIPNAANRTQIAVELLGKSGASLIPLGNGIEEMMKRAEELGLVMSQSDVAAADALGDSVGALGMTFGGLVNTIGSVITSNQSLHTLVGGLQDIVASLTKQVRDNRGALQDLVSGGVELVTSSLILMVDAVELAGTAWDALKLTWLSALNVGGSLAELQLKLRLATASGGPAGSKAADSFDPAVKADLEQQLKMVQEWKALNADAANATVAGNSKWAESAAKVRGDLEKLRASVEAAHGAQVKLTGSTGHGTVELEKNAAAAKAAADASDAWWKSIEQADAASQRAAAANKQWLDSITGMGDAEVTDEVFKIGQAIEEAGGLSAFSAAQVAKISEELQRLKAISPTGFKEAAAAFKGTIEDASVDTLTHNMGNIAAKVGPALKPGMSQLGKDAGFSFSASFQNALEGLGGVIVGAIQGGGDVGKSIGAHLGASIGADLGKSITKAIGGKLGGALGGLAGPLGALAGSVLGGLGDKLFGKLFKSEQKKVNDMRDSFFEAQGGFVEFQKKLKDATNQDLVKKIFNARTVKEFEAAVKEAQDALDLHGEAQQKLQEAIDKYGFTIEELGPKFQQQKLDEMAGSLIQDFRLLTASGIDQVTVLGKMGPAFSEYVQTAIRAGAALPETMRPMIEQLIQSGQLLDENGNAFTSVEQAGLSFTESLTEGLSRMIESIDRLVAALTGAGVAANNIHIPSVPGAEDGGGKFGDQTPQSFAGGSHGFKDFGTGTPAMLHGIEAVIRPGDLGPMRGFGGGPEGGGGTVVNVSLVYSPSQTVNGAGNATEIKRVVDEKFRNDADGIVARLREALAR